jgi:hypothetical protein
LLAWLSWASFTLISEKIKFNHQASDIREALNINNRRASELTGLLFFTEINKAHTVGKLFDDEDEAPKEFTTQTGTLSSVLEEVENLNEVIFATFQWTKNMQMAKREDGSGILASLTMMYLVCDQDRDKFIKMFLNKMED